MLNETAIKRNDRVESRVWFIRVPNVFKVRLRREIKVKPNPNDLLS